MLKFALVFALTFSLSGCMAVDPKELEEFATARLRREQKIKESCEELGRCLKLDTKFEIQHYANSSDIEYVCHYHDPETKEWEGFLDSVTPFDALVNICKMKERAHVRRVRTTR